MQNPNTSRPDRKTRDTSVQELLSGEPSQWDLVVVGGGITGAGIFRQAVRAGLKTLLVEQRDFAWGTSSRSSKMVHGGLRYLAEGAFRLTRESVTERQRFLGEVPGLVDPLPFLYPHFKGAFPAPWLFGIVLGIYDWMAGRRDHRFLDADALEPLEPGIRGENLIGAMQFSDAVTDDSRLVLRLIREGVLDGGVALNYVAAPETIRDPDGRVTGCRLQDAESGLQGTVSAKLVINATGAWADRLRAQSGAAPVIRPLRGSHLVISAQRMPVKHAVSFRHPDDRRPVFVFPWEGTTVIGTTDLDHPENLDREASISGQEADYLLDAVNGLMPGYALDRNDVISSWSGVRPVIRSGKGRDPSREKRDHSIWDDNGMISVSGGKLTTFRVIAAQVLEQAGRYLPDLRVPDQSAPVFCADPSVQELKQAHRRNLPEATWQRLAGHFGPDLGDLLAECSDQDLALIGDGVTLWIELRWAARTEQVVHLDDLMLRRTRIGMLLPEAGASEFDRIEQICQEELGWGAERWTQERDAYLAIWRAHYAPPDRIKAAGEGAHS